MIENLEAMLAAGTDTALLRFSLGQARFNAGQHETACEHLQQAVTQDPQYSAAWQCYGRALGELGRVEAAADAFRTGIKAARHKGDMQAVKAMEVFLRRAEKRLASP